MTAAAAILLVLAGSLACSLWAVVRRERAAWPPRRVVASVETVGETFP